MPPRQAHPPAIRRTTPIVAVASTAVRCANQSILRMTPMLPTDTIFQYKISWNSQIPHFGWYGKFIEFGWWQTHKIGKTVEGYFYTDMSSPLAKPIWHAPSRSCGQQ